MIQSGMSKPCRFWRVTENLVPIFSARKPKRIPGPHLNDFTHFGYRFTLSSTKLAKEKEKQELGGLTEGRNEHEEGSQKVKGPETYLFRLIGRRTGKRANAREIGLMAAKTRRRRKKAQNS